MFVGTIKLIWYALPAVNWLPSIARDPELVVTLAASRTLEVGYREKLTR